MQVDAASFPYYLLGLFIHISEADFVSFDLELSGIPSRLPNKPRAAAGRFTLEERYAEAKAGADRYQILQVGITCARFDYIANSYVLRPYNMNISPLISERLDLEREISMQSGAITFLLGCGFDMAKPFTRGIEYLSRQEAAQVKQATADRLANKNPPADMQLKDTEVDSLDFMRRVREAIKMWRTGTSESLAITTDIGLERKAAVSAISRFEKRLVHQLVRAEYPDLVTMSRSDCVRIIYFDPAREANNNRRIRTRVKEQIDRQTGFRWIFEALAGGDLTNANAMFPNHMSNDVRNRFERAIERLRVRQPVLVGHNMFTDIVYLYRTFVGELPSTLQGFLEAIHTEFPKIIDTKYLATHAEGDLNASPTLQEIAQGLNHQPLPAIITHQDHNMYQEKEAFHEAGYDSLLTATILIRLAAKLGAQHEKQHASSAAPSSKSTIKPNGDLQDSGSHGHKPKFNQAPMTGRQNRRQKKKTNKEAVKRRFQTKNIFENLRDPSLNPEDGTEPSSPETEPAINSEHAEASNSWNEEPTVDAGPWERESYVQDKTGWAPIEQSERHAMELMPSLDSESAFWKEFGNTLRVFGTQEAVLKIADW